MHWEKLKNPIFWAITIWLSFTLYSVVSVSLKLRNDPFTKEENVYLQNLILVVILLALSAWGVITIAWLKQPTREDDLRLSSLSILFLIFGIVQIIIGITGLKFLYNLLSILPKMTPDMPLKSVVLTSTINNALQLPVGGLILYLSLLQLLKNKMMKPKT